MTPPGVVTAAARRQPPWLPDLAGTPGADRALCAAVSSLLGRVPVSHRLVVRFGVESGWFTAARRLLALT